MNVNLTQIAQWIDAKIEGNEDIEITGLAKIEEAQSGHLSFIANPKYAKYIESTNASAVLVDQDFPETDKTVLRVGNPYFAFLTLAQKFYQQAPQVDAGIHETAIIGQDTVVGDECSIGAYVVIGKDCFIGKGTTIFPGTFIGDRVKMGENCLVYPNVSIREECQIGNNCILHMGAVVGSDGFGYAFEGGKFHKLPQMGIVVLEDDVELGANITIDRATMGETRIQKGAKLDNLIQIAHNVQIGQHTALAAQTGISGSTKLGSYVQVGGQAGFAGHLTIGDQAKIGAQAGITKSIPDGGFYSGYPARPFRQEMREHASLAKLPGMLKRFKELEAKVEELEARLKDLSNE
jgi:UDP-3-O-[3-hydroxymyristoyl] glucosamine N-acyltransferase